MSMEFKLGDRVVIPIHDKEAVVVSEKGGFFECEVHAYGGVDWGGWDREKSKYPKPWFPAKLLRRA
jgi:hypothetical protein